MLFWLTFLQTLPTMSVPQPQIAKIPPTQSQLLLSTLPSPLIPRPVVGQLGSGLLFFPGLIGGSGVAAAIERVGIYPGLCDHPQQRSLCPDGGVFAKKKPVILNGGCVVLPGFHELTRVPLREISIDVERTGKLAVRTKDYLRADMRVTFYVCINATEEDVLTAAARLSQNNHITPDNIKNALEKRADDAIRAAAKNKDLAEVDSDKLGFAQEVLNLMQQDLSKVGLTLNNIAISEIQESDTYDTNNFFDAQGVRLRTETIQRSIQQKREVELTTQVAIEQKELDARKRSLQIAQEQESARLEQQFQIAALTAQREREIQESKDREAAAARRNKILQDQAVEEEEIRKQLGVQQSQIQAAISLEERNKQLKVTQSLQQQESEVAEITRQQTVESSKLQAQVQIAESDRLAKLAQEDVAIAVANKRRESFMAEAQRAKAEASVLTATEIEKAERSQRLSVIAAEKDAQEKRVADRNIVEIDAFRRSRQAEVAQQTAALEAEALRTLAAANRDQALAEAEGIRAQMVAQNMISNANLTAQLITNLWPQVAPRLPEILQALAPQPGVLGETRIYAFPNGDNNHGTGDIHKLLLSTSGLALINTLLEEGKLSGLVQQVAQLLGHSSPPPTADLTSEARELEPHQEQE
ncbi:flotillin family protein [Neosynechococcus sphagnicola]|uniref:flotillin family protein n=1 Tax=Neosynechococcus sphagnicola TaxID=1501145 RepID=UPI000ACAE945|nr:SPFH domain-containing protein [Neosynechococcus sphagnicola]